MSTNILVTGAAGYIGGSIVSDFATRKLFGGDHIFAAVRSQEQADAWSTAGINVLRLDLKDAETVVQSIVHHKISIVIHTASAIDPELAFPLIDGLRRYKEASGKRTYFIHTSGLSAFYQNTGWLSAENRDTGPIYEVEKRLADSFPIRKTDVAIIEHAEAQDVTSFVVVPTHVYGRGTGAWNQLSVVLPLYVKASIQLKKVYKFPENTQGSGVHISDITSLYGTIVEHILQSKQIPSGREGYYFSPAHDLSWWEVYDHLATALAARGLVETAEVGVWPKDEAAAEVLGLPAIFVTPLFNSGENMVCTRPRQIGWVPQWDKSRFLKNMDEEVRDVLELGQAKSSLVDSLFQAAK